MRLFQPRLYSRLLWGYPLLCRGRASFKNWLVFAIFAEWRRSGATASVKISDKNPGFAI